MPRYLLLAIFLMRTPVVCAERSLNRMRVYADKKSSMYFGESRR